MSSVTNVPQSTPPPHENPGGSTTSPLPAPEPPLPPGPREVSIPNTRPVSPPPVPGRG
jgi:hypothetical protein